MVEHSDLPRIDVNVMTMTPPDQSANDPDAPKNPSFTQVLITNDFVPSCGIQVAALWCEAHQMIEGALRCRDNDGDITVIPLPAQTLLVLHHEIGKILQAMEARARELGQPFHVVKTTEGVAAGWDPVDGSPPSRSSLRMSTARSSMPRDLPEKLRQLMEEIDEAGEEVRDAMLALGEIALIPGDEEAGLMEVRRRIGLLPDRSKLN